MNILNNAIEVAKQSKCKYYTIETHLNGTLKKRLFISDNGNLCEYAKNMRRGGFMLNNAEVSDWHKITPDYKTQFSKEVSACIALILNPPSSSSRALDKYFENGEYTERLVAEVKKRALKNKRLYDILTNNWKWVF